MESSSAVASMPNTLFVFTFSQTFYSLWHLCILRGPAIPASICSPHGNLCSSLACTIASCPNPLFLLQIQLDLATKPFSCQSDPLSFSACLSQSFSPLFVAVCSQLQDSCVQVLVVQWGMWWGGVEAGEPKKGGAQLFPHRASTPHWSVAHLSFFFFQRRREGKEKGAKWWDNGHSADTHTPPLNWSYSQSILNEHKRET